MRKISLVGIVLCILFSVSVVAVVSDSDMDGVIDSADSCLGSATKVDNYGCDCAQKMTTSSFTCKGSWCCSQGQVCDANANTYFKAVCMNDSDYDSAGECLSTAICKNKNDNCYQNYNPDQKDSDGDGIGDVCETGTRCYDSDPNNSDGLKGYVSINNGVTKIFDTCIVSESTGSTISNSEIVVDYYCNNSRIDSVNAYCDDGYRCSDGICKQANTSCSSAADCPQNQSCDLYFEIGKCKTPTNPNYGYCEDSDDGYYPYLKGRVYWKSADGTVKITNDSCVGNQVMEAVCDYNGYAYNGKTYACPNGCSGGACLPLCKDSDITDKYTDGKNIYQKGTTSGYGTAGTYVISYDECFTDNGKSRVMEYYCKAGDDKNLYADSIACPNGCASGACIRTCNDSDISSSYPDGKNIYQKGTTSGYGTAGSYVTSQDECFVTNGETRLMEYYCKGTTDKNLYADSLACPNGCKDGACNAGKPDLKIKAVPMYAKTWQNMDNVIFGEFCNLGSDFTIPKEGLQISIAINGTSSGWVGYGGETMATGTCKTYFTLIRSYELIKSGTYPITINVDSNQKINESIENNNNLSAKIAINLNTTTCKDTDAVDNYPDGNNIYTKGKVTGINPQYGDAREDGCINNNYNGLSSYGLTEFVCSQNNMGFAWYSYVNCPTGYSCSDGYCKKNASDTVTKTCKDTDYGNNIYNKGKGTLCIGSACSTMDDMCTSDNNLIERYCVNDVLVSVDVDCANGCKNGTCITSCGNSTKCATCYVYASPASVTPIIEGTAEHPAKEISYLIWNSSNAKRMEYEAAGVTTLPRAEIQINNELWYETATKSGLYNNMENVSHGYPGWFHVGTSGTEIITFYPYDSQGQLGIPCSVKIEVKPLKNNSNCTDSDNGLNYEVKGNVTEQPTGYVWQDCCQQSTPTGTTGQCASQADMLVEQYCDAGSGAFISYRCPNGCSNGACMNVASTSCTDTDYGANYFVHGVTTIGVPGTSDYHGDTDYCGSDDKNAVVEYYCQNGAITKITYTCPLGCSNGSCCIDTDGGLNYYVKGTSSGKDDICTKDLASPSSDYDVNGINEMICSNGMTYSGTYSCPYGCNDGKCNSEPSQSDVCTDSDGGLAYNIKGSVSYKGASSTDICFSDAFDKNDKSGLYEYYCDDGMWIDEYNCPNGCQDGACLDVAQPGSDQKGETDSSVWRYIKNLFS